MSDPVMPFLAPERSATERFVLRSWMPMDGAALHQAVASSQEHLATFMAWAKETADLLDAVHNVRGARARYLAGQDFRIAVFTPEEDRVLGGTGFHLHHGPIETRQAEIGMWIVAAEAGLGLGTEVLREMLRWGFEEWGFLRLEWRADVRNVASCRVAEKAGMKREGTLRGRFDDVTGGRRDMALYGKLAAEHP